MTKFITLIAVLLFLTSSTVFAFSQCKCTPKNDLFPGSDVKPSETLQISTDNEFVGSTDVGKLINIGSIVVLQNLAQVSKQSTGSLNHKCPSGYIPVTNADLEAIVKRADFQQLIGKDFLNLSQTVVIFSSDKKDPTITSGAAALVYFAIKFEKSLPKIDGVNAYWTSDDINRKTLCKKQYSSFDISLEGYEGYDLEDGKTYELKITNKNVQKYYIEDSNGKISTSQTFSYTHKGNEQWGCATINFRLQVFGGVIVGDCLSIWTKPQFAFNADSSIKNEQIKKVTLANIKSNVQTGMFFGPGSAPIAPIVNDSSSVYLYYSEKTTNALKVIKLTKEGAQIGETIDTKEVGQPFDIVSTHFGFVVMARDENQKAWISAFNKDGTLRWKRILVDNGKEPTTVTDQIKFHNNDKCELPFGMKVMYNPHNGRLNYARGRIQAIWAHYNHFGLHPDGKKNDHTGDTMISLDADTGFNQKIFWSWGASHSLYQNLHYDGKSLMVSSLSDAYPMNILFKVCDIEQHECESKSTLVGGEIPGNGGGKSSGRQSGFVDIVGNRNEKFFIYSRKACVGGYSGSVSKNDKNEMALIRFDKDLNLISTKVLIEGELAARVNVIKTVRYGKNILVAYSVTPSSEKLEDFNRQGIKEAVDESYLLLLNGADGSTIYGPTKFDSYQVSASDDWRILEDGRIVYTYINKDNVLSFYYTPAPSATPNYPNPIKSSDKIYGFGSFVNSKKTMKRNNFNDLCIKQGDSNFSVLDYANGNQTSMGSNSNSNNNNNNNNSNNEMNNKVEEKGEVTNSLKLEYIIIVLISFILI